jgi:hypothetical protein
MVALRRRRTWWYTYARATGEVGITTAGVGVRIGEDREGSGAEVFPVPLSEWQQE